MVSDVASNMKFGIIVAREFEEFNIENLAPTVESLQMLGCAPDNIVVKSVPTAHDMVIATQFMAETLSEYCMQRFCKSSLLTTVAS